MPKMETACWEARMIFASDWSAGCPKDIKRQCGENTKSISILAVMDIIEFGMGVFNEN